MMIGNNMEKLPASIPNNAYYDKQDSPTFKAYLVIVVRDRDNKVINIYKQKSHSPTTNFMQLLLPASYYYTTGNTVTITNINGSSNAWAFFKGSYTYPNTATNNPSYLAMIQVGSGQQSNPYSVYKLAAPIANGNGPGQLSYSPPAILPNVLVSGDSVSFIISQSLTNSSGATITITEVGVVVNIQNNGPGCGYTVNFGPVLLWYDTLSSPISVPNGGGITIYYTFTVNP
jgi:hypothetical protein